MKAMTAPTDAFLNARDTLISIGDRRVWSIIVTLFGDMAQSPGAEISGLVLSRITELMGIKPEAMRVALHRLRNDGWITSQKTGRTRKHMLSDYGRDLSEKASVRIYARSDAQADQWHMVLVQPAPQSKLKSIGSLLERRGYASVGNGVYFGAASSCDIPEDCFLLPGSTQKIPDWLKENIARGTLNDGYQELEDALNLVNQTFDLQPEFSQFEVAALRILIVHHWRYLVLRSPDLPEIFFPRGWRKQDCCMLVHDTLDRLARPKLKSLGRELDLISKE